MYNDKFAIVLQDDEEIKWSNRVNIFANVLKGMLPTILIGGFFSFWVALFFGGIFFEDRLSNGPYLYPIIYILPTIVILYIVYSSLNARNTYFAITNKRIIKRSGAFRNSFIHYTLKNVGTVQVVGSIVDSKNSATLLVTTKDFHTDAKGNTAASRLKISSLYDAYEAYNTLNELVEGNNENLRVKIEK
jgi:hypothetical protein